MDEQDTDNMFDDDQAADSDSGSDDTAAPPEDTKAPKSKENSDKRVNDLMSKWQSAEAEKRQLQARITELEGKQASNDGEGQPAAGNSAATDEFLEIAREQARTSLFSSDPRFAKYGFEVTAIEGKSAKEMRESADRLRAIVDKVETSARSDALREHGLVPDIAGGPGSEKPLDFASMSDKEILEIGDRMLGKL